MRSTPHLLFCTYLLAGCNPESNIARQKRSETFYQEPPAGVDILWVVDNSESMEEEQAELANRFTDFIADLDLEETEMDFHLGVVTTDLDEDNANRGRLIGDPIYLTRDDENYMSRFQQRVQVGIDGSGKEQGLEAAYMALTEPMASDANRGFLRDDAMLAIIFVSDENDCSDRGALPTDNYCYSEGYQSWLVPVAEYAEAFRAQKGASDRVIASAIVGPEDTYFCESTLPGLRYHQMADLLGGLVGNICDANFAGIMADLGLSVSGVRNTFQLSYSAVEETIEVWVCFDESCDDENAETVLPDPDEGWTWDPETLYLTFNGGSVPPRGSALTVYYEVGS